MRMRSTHTYALLPVSESTYREIRLKLAQAGYEDQFHTRNNQEVIDMHGIAIQPEEQADDEG